MEHIETVYGSQILEHELEKLKSFVVVTDPIPWRLFENHFHNRQARVLMPGTLDQSVLDHMISEIPEDVDFIGLGGGTAIDSAKYFAYLRNRKPILVPTITSSNAPFTDFISVRRNGSPYGFKKEGWPKRVVVDFSLIRKSDPRWNRAGYGDLLYMQTTLNDWRIAADAGRRIPVEPEIEREVTRIMQTAMEHAEEIGSVSQKGLHILMTLLEQSSFIVMKNMSKPITAGAEHLFSWNLEHLTGKPLIHGETVALGLVISSFLQKDRFIELRAALDKAKVVYHPDRIGISWNEIEQTLLTVGEYNRKFRNFYTVFDEVEWNSRLLNEVRNYIYS
jgi:glycerol dehydrogenase-like iron-containing ADH family enzyme